MFASYFVSPKDLWTLIGAARAPVLERGFAVYDALFAWTRFAAEERHNWPAQAA